MKVQSPLELSIRNDRPPASTDWVGGVSNVDIDRNNALQIKAIGAVISTFETLPENPVHHRVLAAVE
jgi:hypothetical protein